MKQIRPSRRDFIRTISAAGAAVLVGPRISWARSDTRLRVLSIGVVGTIGGTDRQKVAAHPQADIVGLCDVDANALAQAAKEHPDAFTCAEIGRAHV